MRVARLGPYSGEWALSITASGRDLIASKEVFERVCAAVNAHQSLLASHAALVEALEWAMRIHGVASLGTFKDMHRKTQCNSCGGIAVDNPADFKHTEGCSYGKAQYALARAKEVQG